MTHKLHQLGKVLQTNYCRLFRDRTKNIYHCCIQKSASQWFVTFFSDPIIWKYTRLMPYNPHENFIRQNADFEMLTHIPTGVIVSPLYIGYKDFAKIPKPLNYKAFCVIRDPRDLIVSNYFSLKYSHPAYNPYIVDMREKLHQMTQDEGMMMCINTLSKGILSFFSEWLQQKDDSVKIFRFEDIFGIQQEATFQQLLEHCDCTIPENVLHMLLNKYCFKNITGRSTGDENITSHYRKGTANSWQDYFSEPHKAAFKERLGQILLASGYEQSSTW